MNIPVMQGIIDRRILVNFRADPDVLARALPRPFQPKRVGGYGIAGVCLIRLKHIRPSFVPLAVGVSSENAAHRIAVQWDEAGERREGVFIPRRDTSSRLNTLIGGRLFPGEHHHARFEIQEKGGTYRIRMVSADREATLEVQGHVVPALQSTSIFEDLEQASRFFEGGSLGYSARKKGNEHEGLELRTMQWAVEPLAVEHVQSSYFSNEEMFPSGSVEFDNALLMTGIEHEWHGRESMYVDPAPEAPPR